MPWTWIGGSTGNWNDSANWSVTGSDKVGTYPSKSGDGTAIIPGGTTVTMGSATNLAIIQVSGTGNVTLSGNHNISLSGNIELGAGQGLDLAGGLSLSATGIALSGTGTSTLGGGAFTISTAVSIAAGQTLALVNATYTSSSGATGAGTLALAGSTLNMTSTTPTVAIKFDTVAGGGTNNTLNIANYATGMTLQNLGYGDVIYAKGDTLQLVANASGGYTLQDTHGGSYTSTVGTVTLAAGTNPADFGMSGGDFVYTGAPACFMAGTRLATPEGEIAVEDIAPGMLLLTVGGAALPVRWVGHSVVATRFADPLEAMPVRIKAGALADNMPVRDLRLSPDHAVFLDGVLVQAGALVNGSSIVRDYDVPARFIYYHIELATHELLLAEGAPAESFVDNVDRMIFHNWDARTSPDAPIAELPYPRAKAHRQVPQAVRQMLAERASSFLQANAAA